MISATVDGVVEDSHLRVKNPSLSSSGSRPTAMRNTSGSNFASALSSTASASESPSMQLFACPSTPGMSQYVSASSLRHASPHFSFSKSDRFPEIKVISGQLGSQKLSPPQSTNLSKSCSFGFGSKIFLPPHVLRNAQQFPSPNHYQNTNSTASKDIGKSFGIPYQYYSKTYVPGSQIQSIEFARELPGVGQYNVMKEPGQDKLKFSLFGKRRDKNNQNGNLASNHYSPKYSLEEDNRFTQVTFGKGTKFDFTAQGSRSKVPGPGTYKLPSSFDKNQRRDRTMRRTAFI